MSGLLLKKIIILVLLATTLLFSGGSVLCCGYVQFGTPGSLIETPDSMAEVQESIIDDPVVPLAQHVPVFVIPVPDAPGLLTESNDRAVIDYSQAIDIDPTFENAFYRRGNSYLNLYDYARAASDYEAVLRLNPANEAAGEKLRLTREDHFSF